MCSSTLPSNPHSFHNSKGMIMVTVMVKKWPVISPNVFWQRGVSSSFTHFKCCLPFYCIINVGKSGGLANRCIVSHRLSLFLSHSLVFHQATHTSYNLPYYIIHNRLCVSKQAWVCTFFMNAPHPPFFFPYLNATRQHTTYKILPDVVCVFKVRFFFLEKNTNQT